MANLLLIGLQENVAWSVGDKVRSAIIAENALRIAFYAQLAPSSHTLALSKSTVMMAAWMGIYTRKVKFYGYLRQH